MERKGVDRRGFLKGAAAAAAGSAVSLPAVVVAAGAAAAADGAPVLGPGPTSFSIRVNGKERKFDLEPRVTLLDALRFHAGVTGPKEVCDRGACGACNVLLEGIPVSACMLLAVECAGRNVVTTEGLGEDGKPHPLHEAFARRDALQCGFCTPGMVVSCAALLQRDPDPSADAVRDAIAGNICRCGTYPRVVEACRDAAAAMKKGK